MATGPLAPVVRYLRKVTSPAVSGELPDAELLAQCARQRDEAAFTALVRRHGPMVLAVCRRVVRDGHAAEDAFQATFLVLACKAVCTLMLLLSPPSGARGNPALRSAFSRDIIFYSGASAGEAADCSATAPAD